MKKHYLMRKCLGLGMALALSVSSLAGCGATPETANPGGDTQVTEEVQTDAGTESGEADEPVTEEVTEVTETEETGTEDNVTHIADELAVLSSKELAVMMGNGFNLGNTMEACDNSDDYKQILENSESPEAAVTHYETLWGQPVTTQEMIDAIHDGGVDTIRIPVAWTNMMDFENGDYTINEALLARVKEIVDYAYNDDMFVIINDHWDTGWWGMFGAKDEKIQEDAMKLYTTMWTQIAEYFKDYDLHLIFEGGNEEIGDRLNDVDNPVVNNKGGILMKDQCYEKALEINQTFVDLVRSTGGNNVERFLLIPGYGTDITQTLDRRWQMPTDTAKDKLFLSVHYYTPWNYCGTSGESRWGTARNVEEMNTLMEKLSKYTEEGYGVIIGECGVLPTSAGNMKPDWQTWYKNFFANCDLYGYVPVNWNTGDFVKKADGSWIDEEFKQFYIDHSKGSYDAQGLTAEDITANAKTAIQEVIDGAPESFTKEEILTGDGNAVAWIMWSSGDWNQTYSVGDTFDPDSATEGLVAKNAQITGEGSYTVGLDFTGTDKGFSSSTAFSAIGISNGEDLFPGYLIEIESIKVNGEDYRTFSVGYTTSDDGHCTRMNLHNEWVGSIPEEARTSSGSTDGCSPTFIDKDRLGDVKTIEITFNYVPGAQGISPDDANSKN